MSAISPLYENDPILLHDKLIMFERFMEPHLRELQTHKDVTLITSEASKLQEYLDICHSTSRKLEYAFALQFLLAYLKPNDCYLDAGCGASPLAHVIAEGQIMTEACDIADEVICGLKRPVVQMNYGTKVNYAVADVAKLWYESDSFDAISCVSVLDHLSVSKVRRAVQELMRVLKPGGLLVITIGFRPTNEGRKSSSFRFCAKLLAKLIGKGRLIEIYSESLILKRALYRQPAATGNETHVPLQDEEGQREIATEFPLTLALQKPF